MSSSVSKYLAIAAKIVSRQTSKRSNYHCCRFYCDQAKKKKHEKVDFDELGTWANRIDLPLLLQESIEQGTPVPWIKASNSGSASIIGRRITNEDRFKVKELKPNLLYLAVFDGHGGSNCADFCNEHMEEYILFGVNQGKKDFEEILETAFLELNNAFARHITYNCPNSEEAKAGTTATVCLLKNSLHLVVAHVGDSRAILCRDGDARKLTTDHITGLKSEKERILKSGGFIKVDSLERGLVNGRLAMTRSLGDLDVKPFGVIAVPDTRTIQVKHGRDAFLILTTDGINFVMTDQEICNAVNNCPDPEEAANLVTDQAMQFASQDNATAVVVPFGAWGKYRNQGNITYNFLRHLTLSERY